MDALDAMILREFGIEPFALWPRRTAGLRLAEVARRIGRNLQFVKDRVDRMEADGVITGYCVTPNLRQCGLDFTTVVWPAGFVPGNKRLSRLDPVDGFVGVFWSLDSTLCLDITHGGARELERRLTVMGELLGMDGDPHVLFRRPFPAVTRRLTPLDWRILAALLPDARRPLADVARELGVTAKTVRRRYSVMWDEGSIDTHVALDFARMTGIVPFGLSLWYDHVDPGMDELVLRHFAERYMGHVKPVDGGYCALQVRIFAYTPAEVQSLVREALDIPGVRHAEPFLVTGAYYNTGWLRELVIQETGADAVVVPERGVRA